MPVHEHDKDAPESIRARAEQDDPSVMYMVVRRERPVALEALLVAGAQAVLGLTATYTDDPRYAEDFARWNARSFRKVCLRANERDWERLRALDGADGCVDGHALVRALPPRLKSEREKLLTQLQAYNAELSEFAREAAATDETGPVMLFVVNDALPMRAGKMLAQIGHAALLCVHAFAPRDPAAFAAWEQAGYRCAVRRASGEEWQALKRDERVAVVRDAGLTEVDPGSETFVALAPAEPARWSARLRALRVL